MTTTHTTWLHCSLVQPILSSGDGWFETAIPYVFFLVLTDKSKFNLFIWSVCLNCGGLNVYSIRASCFSWTKIAGFTLINKGDNVLCGLHHGPTQAIAQGLHNCLVCMTGQGLEKYIPQTTLTPHGLESVTGVSLDPWDTRPCLKSVHDEEATGFKAINFLAGPCGLRVFAEPEGSHPCWNDWLRAVGEAKLKAILLKATLQCNWTRGPFASGTHQLRLADSAADLMQRQGDSEEYMSQMAELVALDKCMPNPEPISKEDWISVCQKRIPKARGKAWFGICDSFGMLDRGWTILSESVAHIQTLEKILKAGLFNTVITEPLSSELLHITGYLWLILGHC